MKDDKKVPQLRFPEFTDAWKQRKLSDIALIVGGGTPSTNNPEYWDGEIDWYAPAEINGQIYADYSERKITKLGLEKSSAKILPAGKTVLFTSRAGIGKTAILRRPAATNQGFQSLVLNDEIDTYFVYSMTEIIKQKAEKIASGSTFAEISGKMLGGLSFMFPKYTEQNKIGTFFSKLDNLITLQQRKLNSLQKLKKGLLQKMFPKNGENIPEIRFPEFSDAWKQRKLGEIIDYSNGIGHENYVLPQGKYELVTLKSINSSGKLVCSEKFVNEDFETLKAETLIMMLSEQAKGMLGMTTIIPCDNKYVLNQRVAALKAHNDVEVHFLTNAINNKQNYFEQMGAGTKVQNITRGHVEECVIELPSLEEQKKIGSLFSKLEVTITLQQRNLESLQKLKKGLLQQMFI